MPVFSPVVAMEDEAVIRNLVTAFEEEMKEYSACKAYAVQAEDEGLHGAASLFRATARAEQVHANNHARVIRHLGGEAIAEIPETHVGATLENLKTALADQRFETDYLYPAFLTAALSLIDTTAIRSFQWALQADKSHIRLYSDAVARLSSEGRVPWACARHDFFVCPLCGYTSENPDAENCPSCNLLWERFETIR
jgi:rubrerythrin